MEQGIKWELFLTFEAKKTRHFRGKPYTIYNYFQYVEAKWKIHTQGLICPNRTALMTIFRESVMSWYEVTPTRERIGYRLHITWCSITLIFLNKISTKTHFFSSSPRAAQWSPGLLSLLTYSLNPPQSRFCSSGSVTQAKVALCIVFCYIMYRNV